MMRKQNTVEKAPIFNIPPELLADIFVLCLPLLPEHRQPRRDAAPLSISQTCRHWRAVSHSIPRLWVMLALDVKLGLTASSVTILFTRGGHRISVDTERELPAIQWLERSGNLPVDICLSVRRVSTEVPVQPAPTTKSKSPSWFGSTFTQKPSNSQANTTPTVTSLRQLLLPISHKTRSIALNIHPNDSIALRRLWESNSGSIWPALVDFKLNMDVSLRSSPDSLSLASLGRWLDLEPCPSLRSVWINSATMTLINSPRISLPWKQLTSVRLREQNLSWWNLVPSFMERPMVIEDLVLIIGNGPFYTMDPTHIKMSRLKDLRMHSTLLDPTPYLSHLVAPALSSLILSHSPVIGDLNSDQFTSSCIPSDLRLLSTRTTTMDTLPNALIGFQTRSCFSLERLTLIALDLSPIRMITALASLPTLKMLELRNTGCVDKNFFSGLRWGPGAGDANILPALEKLIMTDRTVITPITPSLFSRGGAVVSTASLEGNMLDMVESRWKLPYPPRNLDEPVTRLKLVQIEIGYTGKGSWRDGRIGDEVHKRMRTLIHEGLDLRYTRGTLGRT